MCMICRSNVHEHDVISECTCNLWVIIFHETSIIFQKYQRQPVKQMVFANIYIFFLQMFHEHVCIHSMCVNIQPWENSWFFGGDFISRSLVLIVGGNTMVSHKRHRSCWVQWQVRHFPVILHIKIQCGVSSNSASGINVVHVVTFIDPIYSWGNRWILIGWYSNAFENLCVQ